MEKIISQDGQMNVHGYRHRNFLELVHICLRYCSFSEERGNLEYLVDLEYFFDFFKIFH